MMHGPINIRSSFCVCFSLLLHPQDVYVIFLHFIHHSSVTNTIYTHLSYSCPLVCENFRMFVHTLLSHTAPADKVAVAAHQGRLFLRSQQTFGWSTHSRDLRQSNINCCLLNNLQSRYKSQLVRDHQWAEITQSVQRLAPGWKVRRSKPGGGEILRTRSDRP